MSSEGKKGASGLEAGRGGGEFGGLPPAPHAVLTRDGGGGWHLPLGRSPGDHARHAMRRAGLRAAALCGRKGQEDFKHHEF